MTIRRDLNNSAGKISLLGGYLVDNAKQNYENNYFIAEHQNRNVAEKMHVGKLAARLIKNGDVVFFDCGSTIPFIASQIDNSINFTALCCSLNTFVVLQDKPNCELILCGGNYSRHNSSFTPIHLTSEVDHICTTKAFISAAGVDLLQGVTCFNFNEAKLKTKAISKTKQRILVFDHSKINQVHQSYIADLNQFDLLISDQPLPPEFGDNIPSLVY